MKKFCRFIGLVLVVTMALSLNVHIPVSAETQYLPLTDMNEFYAHEITFDDLSYKPNQKNYHLLEFDRNYIKNIFSAENLIFVREETNEVAAENMPSVGNIAFYGPNDVQGNIAFDEENILIFKCVPDYDDKYELGVKWNFYQGWFTFKNKQIFQELIVCLDQWTEQRIKEIDEEQQKPLKNQVDVTDVEILYETQVDFKVSGLDKYLGVCSYIKDGQRVVVPFLSGTEGYSGGARRFFIAGQSVKNNTFLIDMKRAVATYNSGKHGREFEPNEGSLIVEYTIQINVAADGKAEYLSGSSYNHRNGKIKTYSIDMSVQSQTGTLPKELFSPENNVSDEKETKVENKKEETTEKATDDKKQEVEKEKDETEKQDEKTPASDEKENITDDTQMNEKPEEQSDEQPTAGNNYPKHIQAMNDWAQPYVKRATDMGWLIEDIFSGDLQRDMLRGDFCVLAEHMLNTCGIETSALSSGQPPFLDTQNPSVSALFLLGVINGKSSTEFAPMDSITREEAAAILHRMCKVLEMKDVYMDYRLSSYMFADTASFSDWATESIYNIYLHGVMQGVGDDCFDPKSPYSMEQAITTMIRLYDKKEGAND